MKRIGTVTYYPEVYQGSEEWTRMRLGLLTASEMKLVLTPTLKVADNDKMRAHVYELAAQRISQYVEPHYVSDDMLRGQEDEAEARIKYAEKYAPVEECGFITNDKWGFTIGYSPDGLVGDDGLIECKSRRQKFQIQTIVNNVWNDKSATIPAEYAPQLQTALLVSERKWIDFISYSGGLPMATIRVYPIPKVHEAIIEAATAFEANVAEVVGNYHKALASKARLIPTERRVEEEMIL